MLESIELFVEDISTPVTPAVKKNLFDIDGDAELLDENRSDIFHSVVQNLLFVGKISMPNLQPTISFVCSSSSVKHNQLEVAEATPTVCELCH